MLGILLAGGPGERPGLGVPGARVIADAALVAATGSLDAWFNLNTQADLALAGECLR